MRRLPSSARPWEPEVIVRAYGMSRGMTLTASGLVLLIGLTWFGRDVWLDALGRRLTAGGESGSSADFAIIPAADYVRSDVDMATLEEAVRLQREGGVKRIVMSCSDFYGVSRSEEHTSELQSL